ncbi:DoxX family membrane protein [Akkermansia sp. JRP_AM1]
MDTIDSITIIAAAWGLLVLRLTLALILWPHGAQKVLGWFGERAGTARTRPSRKKWAFPPSWPRWLC